MYGDYEWERAKTKSRIINILIIVLALGLIVFLIAADDPELPKPEPTRAELCEQAKGVVVFTATVGRENCWRDGQFIKIPEDNWN